MSGLLLYLCNSDTSKGIWPLLKGVYNANATAQLPFRLNKSVQHTFHPLAEGHHWLNRDKSVWMFWPLLLCMCESSSAYFCMFAMCVSHVVVSRLTILSLKKQSSMRPWPHLIGVGSLSLLIHSQPKLQRATWPKKKRYQLQWNSMQLSWKKSTTVKLVQRLFYF